MRHYWDDDRIFQAILAIPFTIVVIAWGVWLVQPDGPTGRQVHGHTQRSRFPDDERRETMSSDQLFLLIIGGSIVVAFAIVYLLKATCGVTRVRCRCGFWNRPVNRKCWNCGRSL